MTYTSKQARQMGINKKLGNEGEERTINRLRAIGALMPEEIGTPFVITNTKVINKQTWYKGYWKEKVSGDIIAHTVDGTKILAEVKTILDRNLRWSDFKKHQPQKLSENAENAISLLVWWHSTGLYIMNWMDVLATGFGPGKGLTEQQAARLDIEKI